MENKVRSEKVTEDRCEHSLKGKESAGSKVGNGSNES